MPKELVNRFSWSHSRHETFQACPRRYYYHYYGAWNGWRPDADPAVRRLYVLKQLKSRYLWTGGLVHEAIAGLLRPLRSGHGPGNVPGEQLREGTITATLERMRAEFRASRAGAYLQNPGRALGLSEHHYAEEISDARWRELADGVQDALTGFFAGLHWEQLAGLGRDAWLALEELDQFALEDAPVFVKLDVAHRAEGGRVCVLDWKTGRRAPDAGSLQFGIYALYAAGRWEVPPERIEIRVINLSAGCEAVATMDGERLAETRRAILASVGAMRERLRDREANVAEMADFPARVGPGTCRDCVFREVCPEYGQGRPAAV